MAMAARMPMIATTIISSIRVKPCWTFFMESPIGVLLDRGKLLVLVHRGNGRATTANAGRKSISERYQHSHRRMTQGWRRVERGIPPIRQGSDCLGQC